jgi:lipoprotein-anchoring transpeptidase ErfK/SrfK
MNGRFLLIITVLPMNIYPPVGIAPDHASRDRRFALRGRRSSANHEKSATMSCIVLPAASVISRPKSPYGAAPRTAALPAGGSTAMRGRAARSAAGPCRVLSRIIVLAALAAAVPTPVAAQSGRGLGGGFLEFLFSGAAAGGAAPAARPAYAPAAPQVEWHVDPRFDRQTVAYDGEERPGTVIIDTPQRLLYLVEPGGKALRYGIGVGRPGFTWAGTKHVSMKREWPDWRPPEEMLQRRPDLPHYMTGGPENPLGARALYLGSTLYRIHGSNEPWTIGTQVSSGCIRMRNEDVIDLYNRVPVGAKVVVI